MGRMFVAVMLTSLVACGDINDENLFSANNDETDDGTESTGEAVVKRPAFLDKRIKEIKNLKAAGKTPAVAFDLDDTIFDTRGRTLAIGRAFDTEHKTSYFKGRKYTEMLDVARDTAKAVGMEKAEEDLFLEFWTKRFFDGAWYKNDKKITAVITLAKNASAAGAEVYYITARAQWEESDTISQIKSAKLPLPSEDRVISKPRPFDNTQSYKVDELNKIIAAGKIPKWFITESRKDLKAVLEKASEFPPVFFETKMSGSSPELPTTIDTWTYDIK